MSVRVGLDELLAAPELLRGRRYALLAHQASLSERFELAHVALARLGQPPSVLMGPEHGFFGVEQDMVAAAESTDPLTGIAVASLYGDDEASLEPSPEAFSGLDLLVVDLQDIGSRYYTFVATAVWAAQAALRAGCEVWVLDRPNPLGGTEVEGNLPEPGFESFVGAFRTPVRHGLTLAELVMLEARRRGWDESALRVFPVSGWSRSDLVWWRRRPWVAPSPNMPSIAAALIYPGLCLLEATELSEGRGTTRPFQLVGAPGLDPALVQRRLEARLGALDDGSSQALRTVPALFRPQFQKHAGSVCGGVEIVVVAPPPRPTRFGLELLTVLRRCAAESPQGFSWRRAPYEFRSDRPALDLLLGSSEPRQLLDRGGDVDEWVAGWAADEEEFRRECLEREVFLYPHGRPPTPGERA